MTRGSAWSGSSAARLRVGGDLAARPDGAVVSPGMDVPAVARVTLTSEDWVRDVIRNFNADGFRSRYPNTKVATRRSPPCRSAAR
jgi:hypothetical protein